ncbi:MAG TPA: hypothetical protein ENJ44_04930, partial [Oceanospirillales bacterium]|nr:hypothetical protein [Oceanospirillales bacterium]
NINDLSDYLGKQGWQHITPKAWQDVWKALRSDKKSEDFAIIPTTNNGKIESVIFSKQINDKLVALHLWQQPLKIESNSYPVYAGFVSKHRIKQKWGMMFWKSFNNKIENKHAQELFLKTMQNSHKFLIQNNQGQYFIQRIEK